MTHEEARAEFNAARDRATDPDERAKIELLREFFCNPDFREAFSAYSFEVTRGQVKP